MAYLKVDGKPNLVRDTESGAILNTNGSQAEQYRKIREDRINKDKEIEEMKSDIQDIKQLLTKLVEKDGK